MSRDDAYLFDILESAQAILEYLEGKTWDEFSKDALLQDDLPSLVRELKKIIPSS